jgi:hypothetical protein
LQRIDESLRGELGDWEAARSSLTELGTAFENVLENQ